ncbi:GAD-like domain-containing protein [Psychromonas sp. PT13]|uniref:GAD-like domain-containing protein n=1 Tax=Psychromonas sp. PT13 TaxID=3439547 RepID=UPI003EBC94B6
MNRLFNRFYNTQGFGPAIKSKQPRAETILYFQNKLPERLLEYWKKYGFCGWGEGQFWTVNPSDYQELLELWLEGTELVGKDKYYVIARSAFGVLYVWGENSGQSLKIKPNFSMLFPANKANDLKDKGSEKAIDSFFFIITKSRIDEVDLNDYPLFDRALAKLGALEFDEMYGFVPALVLGGENSLQNLQKVKIQEHLYFLAEVGEKRVMADIINV